MAAFIYHVNNNNKSMFYQTKYVKKIEEECVMFETKRSAYIETKTL